jgi:hypothetical protein
MDMMVSVRLSVSSFIAFYGMQERGKSAYCTFSLEGAPHRLPTQGVQSKEFTYLKVQLYYYDTAVISAYCIAQVDGLDTLIPLNGF